MDLIWTEDQALQTMRTVLQKPNATWTTSVQRDSIMAILNTSTDILTIATTGSGKSMLPIIPAMLETNCITVLILPLKSLITDYQRKLKEMNVPFLHYQSQTTPRGFCSANLVLVSIEMAREQHWDQWIAEVDTHKHVKRFCFDEAHYPLTDANFRASLREVYMVRCLPRQLVLFSGTLSLLCEPKIKALFLLGEDTCIFRTPSTNRPELQLIRALPQPGSKIPSMVNALWERHSATFSKEDRALVFVPWMDMGKDVANQLGCDFYNSKDSDAIKEAILHRWHTGTPLNIMVTTSAFSCGNDYPHVRLVIHAGTPRQMMGYIQEISRGGRDQKPTPCYLLPTTVWGSASSTELDDLLGVSEMKDMSFGGTLCLRYATTAYNDGHGIRCTHSPDNLHCSVCLPIAGLMPALFTSSSNPLKRKAQATSLIEPSHTKPFRSNTPSSSIPIPSSIATSFAMIQERKQAKYQDEYQVLQLIESHLNLFVEQCSICYFFNKTSHRSFSTETHTFKACPFLKSPSGQQYVQWKNSIYYNPKTHSKICFICHVPNFGDRLHGPFTGPSACRYLDVILPTLFFAFLKWKPQLEQEFSTTWSSLHIYTTWLCGPIIRPQEKSNLISVFLACMKYI